MMPGEVWGDVALVSKAVKRNKLEGSQSTRQKNPPKAQEKRQACRLSLATRWSLCEEKGDQ